jgi:hypothetical protein
MEAIIKRRHSTMFHVEHRKARELKESLGIGIFLMVFALGDHFFYTIPQGQFIFWFGILVTLSVPRGTFDSKSEG